MALLNFSDILRGYGQPQAQAIVPEQISMQISPFQSLSTQFGGAGAVPGAGAQDSILSRIGKFGTENGQMLGGLMSGAGALWGAYNSGQQLGLAKDAFGLQKRAFETNLANSIASYNTALEDRIRGRSSNPSEAAVAAYLDQHRLRG